MQTYRMSLTRIDENDDESTVLVIEGTGEVVSSALPLLGQLTGVPVRDPAVTYSRSDQDANRYEPVVEQDETGNDADGKPRRKRRTKAEIEADKLAEAAAVLAAQQQAPTVQPAPAPFSTPTDAVGAPGTPPPGWSPFGPPAPGVGA